MSAIAPLAYSIRIGVVGHRALDDPAAVLDLVRSAMETEIPRLMSPQAQVAIEQVRKDAVTPVSWCVLSPLAEGADRLVARAVLEYPAARLVAVLPLAVEDYIEDFTTEESRQEFRELLALSRRPVILRKGRIRDDCHDPAACAELRRDAYKAAGEYVVDHCDVLIAVWDGEAARGPAGTAATVKYAVSKGRPVIRVWADACSLLNPGAAVFMDVAALEAMDRFNREPVSAAKEAEYVRNLDRALFEAPRSASAIPAADREMVKRLLLPYYAKASIVAKRNQRAFYRAGRGIHLLSAVAVACAAVGVLWQSLGPYAFGTELVVLLVVAAWLYLRRHRDAHHAWLEHRFLVERLRSGIFMAIAGVEPEPIELHPYFGRSQVVGNWAVRLFNSVWDGLPALHAARGEQAERIRNFICEAWIDNQIEFHEKKQRREGRMRLLLTGLTSVVLPLTALAAALHMLLAAWGPNSAGSQAIREAMHRGLALIALVAPAVAAAVAGMEAPRERRRLQKRHAEMVPELKQLKQQMALVQGGAYFEALLRQMDELTLRETQDWLMLMHYVEITAG